MGRAVELRNLGPSGLRVTSVGLGCNGFSTMERARPVFEAALDQGINFFDTADLYGKDSASEQNLGELITGRRHEVIIATKCGFMPNTYQRMGASRRHIMWAVEGSLKRLRTDYIDLYQIHSPDPLTPIEETLRALEDLIRQGKARYVGGSNYLGYQTMEAHWTAKSLGLSGFISGQSEYSLLAREIDTEVIPAMTKCGLGLLPYFPLATGLLSGKYRDGVDPETGKRFAPAGIAAKLGSPESLAKVERLRTFAEGRGHTMLELAMSWLACNPVVSSVIAGASRPDQVVANVAASAWKLSEQDMAEIDSITVP
jgi:aryl-alcohol dehydrogenase-like predicted oxidoreductase